MPTPRAFGSRCPGQPLRAHACTQLLTAPGTPAWGPALTHDIEEDVARCQDHLLPRGTVVDAHVALVGTIVRDADLGQPGGGRGAG